MSDSLSLCALPNHRTNYTVLACLVLLLTFTSPLLAAEQVELVVTGIKDDVLKNVLGTLALPAGMTHEGKVDQLWLERFVKQADAKTRNALQPFGYYTPQVTITVEPDGERYRLLVKVTPGEQTRLTAVIVTLTGPGKEESRLLELIASFPLHKGDALLQQRYVEAREALKARAQELGYLDADFATHEIRVAQSTATATISLVLATGAQYYFGATRIEGAPDYPDSFLRRHLSYAAGALFYYPLLGETQRNFTNSERFQEVNIIPDIQAAEAYRVPISIQLKAAPPKSVRPGIGYGTDTGARFTVRYRDANMFHQGHEFYSQLYVAERLQGLVTGYVLPSPEGVGSSTSLRLNLQQEETTAYDSRITALELERNRSFGKGKLGAVYAKAQYEDYAVGTVQSFSRLLLPGLRFSDNRYDNPIRPYQGFRYALDLRGTHQVLGSDTRLVQLLTSGSYLVPLPWRLSLHTRAESGVTLLNDSFSNIPPSLRFFTGGDQSVRGYSYKDLGPRDASGQVVGGRQLLVGSIELERALFSDWGVSIFYDAGNAFDSFSTFRLYEGVGVGLHYFTSVGGLNLAVAKPLDGDNPSFRIHFTVGFEL